MEKVNPILNGVRVAQEEKYTKQIQSGKNKFSILPPVLQKVQLPHSHMEQMSTGMTMKSQFMSLEGSVRTTSPHTVNLCRHISG